MTAIGRLIAALIAATALTASPAHAHHGYTGPVRLYLETVSVEPVADGWRMRAAVNDSGSGKPAPGFVVHARGSGPQDASFGPVPLTDTDADGRYEAELGSLPAGDWSVTVEVTDAPNSEERAVPITRTSTVTLQPAQGPVEVIGRRLASASGDGAGSSSGGSVAPLVYGVVGGGVLVGLVGMWLARRPRARTSSSSTVH